MARTKMQKSSGNVFRDVGFSEGESASMKIRAELMLKLSDMIQRRNLTQAEAAKLLGVTQPRLVDMVCRTGGSVRVAVTGTKRAAA
jgi:predicted XRE-type DNA-binding protein